MQLINTVISVQSPQGRVEERTSAHQFLEMLCEENQGYGLQDRGMCEGGARACEPAGVLPVIAHAWAEVDQCSAVRLEGRSQRRKYLKIFKEHHDFLLLFINRFFPLVLFRQHGLLTNCLRLSMELEKYGGEGEKKRERERAHGQMSGDVST